VCECITRAGLNPCQCMRTPRLKIEVQCREQKGVRVLLCCTTRRIISMEFDQSKGEVEFLSQAQIKIFVKNLAIGRKILVVV